MAKITNFVHTAKIFRNLFYICTDNNIINADIMIRKYYEVSCDICGKLINSYNNYKPSIQQLRKDCDRVVISHGRLVTICQECNSKDERVLKQRIIEVVAKDICDNEVQCEI